MTFMIYKVLYKSVMDIMHLKAEESISNLNRKVIFWSKYLLKAFIARNPGADNNFHYYIINQLNILKIINNNSVNFLYIITQFNSKYIYYSIKFENLYAYKHTVQCHNKRKLSKL